jgi:hypothetical protein
MKTLIAIIAIYVVFTQGAAFAQAKGAELKAAHSTQLEFTNTNNKGN